MGDPEESSGASQLNRREEQMALDLVAYLQTCAQPPPSDDAFLPGCESSLRLMLATSPIQCPLAYPCTPCVICTPLHTIVCPCIPVHSLACPCTPLQTLAHPCLPLHTLAHICTPLQPLQCTPGEPPLSQSNHMPGQGWFDRGFLQCASLAPTTNHQASPTPPQCPSLNLPQQAPHLHLQNTGEGAAGPAWRGGRSRCCRRISPRCASWSARCAGPCCGPGWPLHLLLSPSHWELPPSLHVVPSNVSLLPSIPPIPSLHKVPSLFFH